MRGVVTAACVAAFWCAAPGTAGAGIMWSQTDPIEDLAPEWVDIHQTSFYAVSRGQNLLISIDVIGLFPEVGTTDATIELFFDSDDDALTGQNFGNFRGIERVARLRLGGAFPFREPKGTFTSELEDLEHGVTRTLQPAVARRHYIVGVVWDPAAPPSAKPLNDFVEQTIPMTLIGPAGRNLVVGVRLTDHTSGATDDAQAVVPLSGGHGGLLPMGVR